MYHAGRPTSEVSNAALDKLHTLFVERFTPPFYETITEREAAEITGYTQANVHHQIQRLIEAGRLEKTPSGRAVPTMHRAKTPDYSTLNLTSHLTRAALQAAPAPGQTASGQEWLDHRE